MDPTYVDPIVRGIGGWLSDITIASIVIRIALAAILGGLIGVERGSKRQAAGLRTYILVATGSALVMITNQYIYETFANTDIARLGAQVISGIGFLGAGTILITSKNQIRGLTTAAGLWACACMGLAIGIGFYTAALLGFIIIMIAVVSLPRVEKLFIVHGNRYEYQVEFLDRTSILKFIQYGRKKGLQVQSLASDKSYYITGMYVFAVLFEGDKRTKKNYPTHKDLFNDLEKLEYVHFIKEIL